MTRQILAYIHHTKFNQTLSSSLAADTCRRKGRCLDIKKPISVLIFVFTMQRITVQYKIHNFLQSSISLWKTQSLWNILKPWTWITDIVSAYSRIHYTDSTIWTLQLQHFAMQTSEVSHVSVHLYVRAESSQNETPIQWFSFYFSPICCRLSNMEPNYTSASDVHI